VNTNHLLEGFSFCDARGYFKKSRVLGVFLKKERGLPEVSMKSLNILFNFCFCWRIYETRRGEARGIIKDK